MLRSANTRLAPPISNWLHQFPIGVSGSASAPLPEGKCFPNVNCWSHQRKKKDA